MSSRSSRPCFLRSRPASSTWFCTSPARVVDVVLPQPARARAKPVAASTAGALEVHAAEGSHTVRSWVAWLRIRSHRSPRRSVTGSRARSSGPPRPRRRRGRRSRAARTCSSPPPPGRARRSPPSSGGSTAWWPIPARARPAGLRLAAEGPLLRRREEPARAAEGHRRRHLGGHPHRRHAAEGAPGDAAQAARRAHHHPRVAVPDAHLAGARVPGRHRVGDRRRDPRRRPHQARRSPRADAGASRARGRPGRAAHRPVGHPASAGGGRALSRGHRPQLQDRGRRRAQAARPEDPGAGGGHARARAQSDRPAVAASARRRRGDLFGEGSATRPPPRARSGPPSTRAARAGQAAPLDDHLREQPARRRAPGRPAQRAGGRGRTSRSTSPAPTTARWPARSAWWSRTCSSRASCPAWWPPPRSSWASTWARSTS